MAEYLFKCRKCSTIYVFSGELGAPVTAGECSCGGMLVRKYTAPAVIYRGSGFYTNDKVLSEPTEDDLYK